MKKKTSDCGASALRKVIEIVLAIAAIELCFFLFRLGAGWFAA
jgi:hypothetical protein